MNEPQDQYLETILIRPLLCGKELCWALTLALWNREWDISITIPKFFTKRKKKKKISYYLHILFLYLLPLILNCCCSPCLKQYWECFSSSATKCQCCPHIQTSQLICCANPPTGFYMRATQALNGLIST